LGVRQFARLAAALLIVFVLVTLTNSAPSYFGPLKILVSENQDFFVGFSLILVSSIWLWRSGYLRGVQSRGRLAALEFIEAGTLLLALTAVFGLGLSPLNMCLGGGGGFTCYPTSQGFLRGLLDLMCIVLGEELFFVAYVTRELNQIFGVGVVAVFASTLFYSFSHFPALQVEGFGTIFLLGFLQILLGTLSLIACYWYTERNLAAVILLHSYWDGIGALVLFPNVGQAVPILVLLGQLSLPAAALVVTHRLGSRLFPG
jgi:membrane protease YdiL (CAAX protease family)